MKIQIDPHTLERAKERGANADEIKDVIETGTPVAAKHDRLSKAKVYAFGQMWNNKLYSQKRVQVVYAIEHEIIVTVTVYVFYGSWE